jgi:Bacterial Ig-like domain (group 3)
VVRKGVLVSTRSLTRFYETLFRVLFAFTIAYLTQTSIASAAAVATTTTLTANPASPDGYGSSVTFTATTKVTSSGTGVTSGSTTITDTTTSSTLLPSTAVNGSGVVTSTATTTLSAGTQPAPTASAPPTTLISEVHTITAVYAGNGSFLTSTTSISYTVDMPVNIACSATPTTIIPSQSVTLTCHATSPATGAAVASGTISIFDNLTGTTLSSGVAVGAGGVMTFPTTAISQAGIHVIAFNYSDTSPYVFATTANVIVGTSTTTTGSASPTTQTFGSNVNLMSTVTSSGGTPDGTVNFTEGLGTMASPIVVIASGPLSGGSATVPTTALGGGTHSITATYVPPKVSQFTASSAASPFTVTINLAPTTTTTGTPPPTTTVGTNVSLTASVTSSAGIPGGSVAFADGSSSCSSNVLGNAPLANGTATLVTTQLGAGSHTITACYSSSINFAASHGTMGAFTITPTNTTTTLTAASTVPGLNSPDLLTATVATSPTTSTLPTGSVTFSDGATTLGSGPVALNGSGQATLNWTATPTGSHSITATYGATTSFNGSASSAQTVVVGNASTTTALTVSPATPFLGTNPTYTAVVTASDGSTPSGNVQFTDGSFSANQALVGGQASVTESSIAGAGQHTIVATYSGADGGSSAMATFTATTATATTIVVANHNPTIPFTTVTYTATVTSPGAAPTGTVTFRNGGTPFGAPPGLSGGTTSATLSTLNTGQYTITATYSGDTNNVSGVPGSVIENVGTGLSSTGLSVSPTSAAPTQNVTLTATVTGSTAPNGGTVIFKDGGTQIGSPQSLASGSANIATQFTSAATHNLTATYSGDSNDGTSTSATIAFPVAQPPTTTALSATSSAAALGSPVTFTAAVSGSADLPTGTVTFKDGGTSIGTPSLDGHARASLTITTLAAGSHMITANYGGDAENQSSTSSNVAFNVTNGNVTDFSISPTVSNQQMLGAGQSMTIPVTLTGASTFNGTVTITCSGLPTGAVCTSTPTTVSGTTPVTVNVTLTTTGAHSGSVTPMAAVRRAALPIAGVFTFFMFLWRRNRKVAMGAAMLSMALLAACGGGGGGGTLPGVGSGNGFGSTGPALPTPSPASGGNGGTPGPGQGTPNLANGTGDIVAGTGQVGSVSTNQLPPGVVLPNAIPPGTIVAGALMPGTSSGPSGNTQQGTYNISIVATGPNGVAHTLPINIVVSP